MEQCWLTRSNGFFDPGLFHDGLIYTEARTPVPLRAVATMQIYPAAGNILLIWPASATNAVLQQNLFPAAAGWTDLPATPAVTNGENQVSLPVSNTECLSRLKLP